ncbi:DUF1667 domain-containing protein [Caproiciproducens sp. CPB-2]|uniref:DUF1667 domain-containing protein n=1 Tax=Caproiciproducens sp. CPB-2 TaxID=3030017 RepID=UPI0023D9B0B1|nr:DUF1667 domain-containing protein [Caproiciproducens sp. CPB-2]MDF1493487.1 DUF1667 domain-containing protein [Caproiciproducens sp. CPB-2]
MEKRELICIGCPLGCMITVDMQDGKVVKVTGNTCPRGEKYAVKEVTCPTRIVTSSVRVSGGDIHVLSVKTREAVPKEKIFDCANALKTVKVAAPVRIGDIILKDAAGTGIPFVATKNVKFRSSL